MSKTRKRKGYRKNLSRPRKRHRAYRGSTNYAHTTLNFEGFPHELRPVTVLSLFDGIGTAIVALQKLNLCIRAYYSSEIDSDCNLVLKYNHGDKVTQIGCVTSITHSQLISMNIDVLIGGSPCNEVSRVNATRKRFAVGSSACLLYEYVRIRNSLEAICAQEGRPFYYLYENTANMDSDSMLVFNRHLTTSPIIIDAKYYTAMRRRRCFWGNIPGMHMKPLLKSCQFTLDEYLSHGRTAVCDVLPTITGNSSSEKIHGEWVVRDVSSGDRVPLYMSEIERLFGFPTAYLHGPLLSNSVRRKMIGRAMCVDVLVDILRPLTLAYLTDHNRK